jgi:hypothetical protein
VAVYIYNIMQRNGIDDVVKRGPKEDNFVPEEVGMQMNNIRLI